jgi:hypothetical protein
MRYSTGARAGVSFFATTESALGRGGDDVMAVTMAATMAPRPVAPLLCLVLLGPYAAAWGRATDG